jgi:hypothetical protein
MFGVYLSSMTKDARPYTNSWRLLFIGFALVIGVFAASIYVTVDEANGVPKMTVNSAQSLSEKYDTLITQSDYQTLKSDKSVVLEFGDKERSVSLSHKDGNEVLVDINGIPVKVSKD